MNETPTVRFRADVDVVGQGEVHVDETPVTDQIRAFRVEAGGDEPTRIVVELRPGASALDVEGKLHVIATEPTDGILNWLATIDADELERDALNLGDMGTPIGETFLTVLKRYAGGT
jgi:hypothetical protein